MKKIISKISLLALVLCLVFSLSGCGSKDNNSNKDSKNNSDENTANLATDFGKDDLKVFEYMDKIQPENTVKEINSIIGSEGKLVDEKYNKYTWKITDDTTLTATYYTTNKSATLTVNIDDDLLEDDKTDLSDSSSLKSELNSTNGVKYEDIVSKFGTNGYLVEKSSSSTSYRWVNKDGGYIRANFSNSTGKCTSFYGMV